jgi:hypothetical protein
MKYFRLSFLLFGFAFLIASCQKELSYEAGLGKGTLKKDVTGECLPVNVIGSYQKDTLLKLTGNYVDIQIDVSEVGSYSIKTDTINGYSFSGAGVFNVQGINTVRLIGAGKPLMPGFDMFTLKFDTSVCQFNVNVTGSGGGGGSTSAVFTLVGSPSACTAATQSNNYYATVATNTTNTINIKVDVTTAGTYTISTPLVNGVSFSSTGNLVVGTNQTVTLLANGGTPTAAGSFPYSLTTTAPASNCGFNLTVQAAPVSATYTFECPSSPRFFGNYQAGVSTSGDSVRINVTSVAGGSYNITTATTTSSNGVTFAGSGVLAASPNPQSVTLFASGTPVASGPFTYTLTGSGVTSTCTFMQTYSIMPVASTDSIVASIDGVYRTFKIRDSARLDNTTFAGYTTIGISGENNTAGDESFSLVVAKMGASLPAGTYTVNQGPTAVVFADYSTLTNSYMVFTDTIPQNPGFTITITSITSTRVIGTFSGKISDNAGAGPGFKTVTNGIFSVKIYP